MLASLSLGLAAATPVAPCGLFLGGEVPLGPATGTLYVPGASWVSLDVFALSCLRTCTLCLASLTGEEPCVERAIVLSAAYPQRLLIEVGYDRPALFKASLTECCMQWYCTAALLPNSAALSDLGSTDACSRTQAQDVASLPRENLLPD